MNGDDDGGSGVVEVVTSMIVVTMVVVEAMASDVVEATIRVEASVMVAINGGSNGGDRAMVVRT